MAQALGSIDIAERTDSGLVFVVLMEAELARVRVTVVDATTNAWRRRVVELDARDALVPKEREERVALLTDLDKADEACASVAEAFVAIRGMRGLAFQLLDRAQLLHAYFTHGYPSDGTKFDIDPRLANNQAPTAIYLDEPELGVVLTHLGVTSAGDLQARLLELPEETVRGHAVPAIIGNFVRTRTRDDVDRATRDSMLDLTRYKVGIG